MEATLLPVSNTGWAPDFPSRCLVTLYYVILASMLCLPPKYYSWLKNYEFFFPLVLRVTIKEKMGTRDWVVPVLVRHAVKMDAEVEVKHHAFLILAVDANEWSALWCGCFSFGEVGSSRTHGMRIWRLAGTRVIVAMTTKEKFVVVLWTKCAVSRP